MRIEVLTYLAIGVVLGVAWNQAEFGRAPPRRLLRSLFLAVFAWPVLVAGAAVIATIWSRIERRRRGEGNGPARRRRLHWRRRIVPPAAPRPSH